MTVVCPDCDCAVPYHSADCPSRPHTLDRNAIIEECARIAESNAKGSSFTGQRIAAAIRALKEKP